MRPHSVALDTACLRRPGPQGGAGDTDATARGGAQHRYHRIDTQ
ncbi:hypothetical protein [Halocatena halophila]